MPAKKPISADVHNLCMRIRTGNLTDAELVEVVNSVGTAVGEASAAFRWKITLPDFEIRQGDMKPSEAERICRILDLPWAQVHPAADVKIANAILLVMFQTRRGCSSEEDARTMLDGYTMEHLEHAVSGVYAAPPIGAGVVS